MAKAKVQKFKTEYRTDFSGGVNNYYGPRQIKDNESPISINCDFMGKSGIGTRDGYTEIGSVADSREAIYGMTEFHTSTLDYIIKFASNASNVALYYSNGSTAWTAVTGTTFTDATNIDVIQAGSKIYSANGTDAMQEWGGTTWSATSNGTVGYYPEYYNKRLWVVDETNKYILNFSGQWAAAGSKLGDFADATAGTVEIRPGSGYEIRGIKSFKDYLYVFLYPYGIYRISPASAANTFTVELVTNSIGCVSHRSICQVGEDLFFAADDGVYSLGDVANYTEVRTTNRSAKIQSVFDDLSGTSKTKLCAAYYNFKYHLFYPRFGGENDSCVVYDVRYRGWQSWHNIAANSVTNFTNSSDESGMYFGEPSSGKIMQMYEGDDDDGSSISTTFYTKSYDEGMPDILKLYYDTTFIFGALNGSVTLSVIFNDNEVSSSHTLEQEVPQGGWGRHAAGNPITANVYGTLPKGGFGACDQDKSVTTVINEPQRLKAKDKKFAVQYKIESTDLWRLDGISQWFFPFDHWKFPSENKLN